MLWAGLTFWLSSSPDAQGVGGFLDLSPPWDKLYHAGNFGVLAGLLYLATGRVWLAVLLASAYGVSDEASPVICTGARFRRVGLAGRHAWGERRRPGCLSIYLFVAAP